MPRVFLCDDEPNYRSLLRVILGQADGGYEIVGEASEGREAIDLATALQPDLVLIDINMSGMGGLEALPLLRAALPDAKIIALTTSWRSAWEKHFRQLGGDGFIEKPRDAFTLPALLEAVLSTEDIDPLDVAEEMFNSWWADEQERFYDVLADDIRYTPLSGGRPIVGPAAIRRYAEAVPDPERQGRARAIRMLALHDVVVIEGTADIPHADYRERFSVAWVLRVRHGKVSEITTYRDWEEARTTAGLTGGIEPTGEREFGLGAGWVFALARRLFGGSPLARAA